MGICTIQKSLDTKLAPTDEGGRPPVLYEDLIRNQADNEPAFQNFLAEHPQLLDPMAVQIWQEIFHACFKSTRAVLRPLDDVRVRASGITKKTIADLERGATTPRAQTLDQILAAFEAAGIEFLNGNRPGVRLNRVRPRNARC